MEVSGQLHAPAGLSPEKEPLYAHDTWLSGPYSRSGRHGMGNNILLLPEIQPLARRYTQWAANKLPSSVTKRYSI
jgi:hypothetical protein